jgi:DNA-binding Lrp family transcriptional regulator
VADIAPRGLSFEQASKYLGGDDGPCRSVLQRLRADGTLKTFTIGVRVFFLRESLDAFIAAQTAVPDDAEVTS